MSGTWADRMRDYAAVRVDGRPDRVYLLFPAKGTAELANAPGVGPAATPARYDASGEESAPLRIVLDDGRSFIVTLRTCDECGAAFEGYGCLDGEGNLFCEAECRRHYQWRTP